MTAPDRPPAGGTHRKSSRASRLAVLLASLVGVAVVAVAVVVVLDIRGEPVDHSAAPAVTSAAPSDSSSPQPAVSTGTLSTGPTTSATPTPASSTPQTAVTSQGAAPNPSLAVLNDSRITGLARRAASQFSAAGWDVAVIGNFSGSRDVPETTIFFPDGAQAAAQRFADRFGIDRVLPAPSFLSASHLSVVLARDWDERR